MTSVLEIYNDIVAFEQGKELPPIDQVSQKTEKLSRLDPIVVRMLLDKNPIVHVWEGLGKTNNVRTPDDQPTLSERLIQDWKLGGDVLLRSWRKRTRENLEELKRKGDTKAIGQSVIFNDGSMAVSHINRDGEHEVSMKRVTLESEESFSFLVVGGFMVENSYGPKLFTKFRSPSDNVAKEEYDVRFVNDRIAIMQRSAPVFYEGNPQVFVWQTVTHNFTRLTLLDYERRD